jgi:hypothetical protein
MLHPTNFMEQTCSWEANIHVPIQEGSYHVHKSFPESHKCSPHHPTLISLTCIFILSSHLCLSIQTGFFPLGFPTKILYAFLISPMCATCCHSSHPPRFDHPDNGPQTNKYLVKIMIYDLHIHSCIIHGLDSGPVDSCSSVDNTETEQPLSYLNISCWI